MTSLDKSYKTTVEKRADAFLEYAGALIAEDFCNEYDEAEAEAADIQLPAELDHKMRQTIRGLEKRDARKRSNHRMRSFTRVAVVTIVCLGIAGSYLMVNVSAFREEIFGFFTVQKEDYVDLGSMGTMEIDPAIKAQFPEEWTEVLYPMVLPDGYEFYEARDTRKAKVLVFINDKQDKVFLQQYPTQVLEPAVSSEEGVGVEETLVGKRKGVYTLTNGQLMLVWIDGTIQLQISGKLEIDSGKLIGENLQLIEIKN